MKMKTNPTLLTLLAAGFILITPTSFGQNSPSQSVLNVAELSRVPDGHYRVNLEWNNRSSFINVLVRNGGAEVVAASDSHLQGMRGSFRLLESGRFALALQNDLHRATQVWIFRGDGSAAVREVPDRGEQQMAVPVTDSTIERPKLP